VIALQPVSMPCCTFFEYDSNDLGPSRYFHHAPLHRLEVKSGQWSVWRGNYQFISFLKPVVMANAQSLTTLNMHGQCSESLLNGILKLVPALESLGLGLISPHALSEKFYQQFVATDSCASSSCEVIWLPRLNCLDLSYKRWLRDSERKTLIPVFADIVESHQELSLLLSFPKHENWDVKGQVESFGEMLSHENIVMGTSSPLGIVLLSLFCPPADSDCWPFKEAEYLYMGGGEDVSIDVLSTLHHLVQLRMGKHCYFIKPTVTKPPTPRFFPIFSGHFDTHFAFLCFQPQGHQPQRSGSQPQQSGSPPPATKTGSPTTCHHVSLCTRLLYIQLSETDTLLFSLHTFSTYSCLRQTCFYSHSTPSLLNSCLRQTRFLFSLHRFPIHSLYLITQRHMHSFTVS
jgi:hypothetical protein